jgi:hypothetical protein
MQEEELNCSVRMESWKALSPNAVQRSVAQHSRDMSGAPASAREEARGWLELEVSVERIGWIGPNPIQLVPSR